MSVTIVAIEYLEPEWVETCKCIARCSRPVIFVDRKGTGSLAKAINEGFAKGIATEFVWFVTNVTFQPNCLDNLLWTMRQNDYAAIHAAFVSDHKHLQPRGDIGAAEVPFIEFTAPLIRTEIFKQFPLDEDMPYWGHDLDWSYRVREAGHKIAVHHGVMMGHEYIRHNKRMHPVTEQRKARRKATDGLTEKRMIEKYGPGWRKIVWPQT